MAIYLHYVMVNQLGLRCRSPWAFLGPDGGRAEVFLTGTSTHDTAIIARFSFDQIVASFSDVMPDIETQHASIAARPQPTEIVCLNVR